jgi:hypothetical protein
MDCEYCNKSFDSKSKVVSHQKTKKCQQFRTITFVCRNCSLAILGYDNVVVHVESCPNPHSGVGQGKPILHNEIVRRLASHYGNKDDVRERKNVFGKGLDGKAAYIYNYEKSILTCGVPQTISESIITAIDNLVEKATLKTVNETLGSFSREAIIKEVSFEYPQPYSMSDISKFFEFETRTVMAFVIANDLKDLFQVIFNSKVFPVCFLSSHNDVYIIDKVVNKVANDNNVWTVEWKKNSPKEVALSFKGFFLPALNYAVKLFLNEGPNHITQKILELIKEINDPSKINDLLSALSSNEATINILKYDDVNNVVLNSKFVFEGLHKHTPMDTFIKNVYLSSNTTKNAAIQSLIISMTKENERGALLKKLKASLFDSI